MPVTINGTTGITTPNLDSAGTVTTSSLVNGTALSFRNKIINGNFGINQRAYVSGTATSGVNQYTLDRWRVVTSGQNLTFSASGTGNIVTAPAGGIEQVIESLNIEGGTYTLSWTGTATGAVNGSAVSNGGQVTLTANTNATIKFSSGTVSLVQLEAGSVATPFENRPIGTELALCQRYYYRTIVRVTTRPLTLLGFANTTTLLQALSNFPVPMRIAPTSLEQTGTASDYNIVYGGSFIVCNLVPTFNEASELYARTSASVASGLTVGSAGYLRANTINGYLGWSAEL